MDRISVVCAVCLGLAQALAAAAWAQRNAQQLFFDGYELLKSNKAAEAVAKFEAGLKSEPNNAKAHYISGRSLSRHGAAQPGARAVRPLELDPGGQVSDQARKRLAELSDNPFAPLAQTFKDCTDCPEMVVVPAGRFTMGSPEIEPDRFHTEGRTHEVAISRPFSAGKHEITREQFAQFVGESGYDAGRDWRDNKYTPSDPNAVVAVSWSHALACAKWLAKKTGKPDRLVSEAEWEYAARVGSTTAYSWGREVNRGGKRWANDYDNQIAPVGSLLLKAFGLYDTAGNVWEWVEDCWNKNYAGASTDGSAWLSADCSSRVFRGGAYDSGWRRMRSAVRQEGDPYGIYEVVGFRVARTLP